MQNSRSKCFIFVYSCLSVQGYLSDANFGCCLRIILQALGIFAMGCRNGLENRGSATMKINYTLVLLEKDADVNLVPTLKSCFSAGSSANTHSNKNPLTFRTFINMLLRMSVKARSGGNRIEYMAVPICL